eukprot:9490251-Pyramimonas_sp.AAC.1
MGTSPGCTRTFNNHEEYQGTLPEPNSILYLGPTVSGQGRALSEDSEVLAYREMSWAFPEKGG